MALSRWFGNDEGRMTDGEEIPAECRHGGAEGIDSVALATARRRARVKGMRHPEGAGIGPGRGQIATDGTMKGRKDGTMERWNGPA